MREQKDLNICLPLKISNINLYNFFVIGIPYHKLVVVKRPKKKEKRKKEAFISLHCTINVNLHCRHTKICTICTKICKFTLYFILTSYLAP